MRMKKSLFAGSAVAIIAIVTLSVISFSHANPTNSISDSSEVSHQSINDSYFEMIPSDIYTELIEFELNDDVNENEFLTASKQMEEEFFKNHIGFISRHVIKSEEGSGWMVINRYENAEQCQLAGDEIFDNMESFEIFNYIDESTIKITNYIEKSAFQLT